MFYGFPVSFNEVPGALKSVVFQGVSGGHCVSQKRFEGSQRDFRKLQGVPGALKEVSGGFR